VSRSRGPAADRNRTIYLPPWRIDLTTRAGVRPPISTAAIARAAAAALDTSGAPEPASVAVVLTDDGELADLNAEHMGIDGPTDVLSFPMLPPESFRRGDPSEAGPRKRKRWVLVRRRPRTHIGDIAISLDRAIEQADRGRGGQTGDVRWSPADELRLLVTHGTLHLCGWDHADPAEEAAMRGLEHRLLR
jgi:probable rRNA maturation factor